MDFLKWLAIVLIVIGHQGAEVAGVALPHGYIGCELFFMITGFFLARAVVERGALDTVRYMRGKIRRVWPSHLLVSAVALCFVIVAQTELTPLTYVTTIRDNPDLWYEVFLIHRWGFTTFELNIVSWYLSAMLFGALWLHAALSTAQKGGWVRVFLLLGNVLMFVIWAHILQIRGLLAQHRAPDLMFTDMAALRGLADMMAGVDVYFLARRFKGCQSAIQATLLEVAVVLGVIIFMFEPYQGGVADLGGIAAMGAALIISVKCRGAVSQRLGGRALRFLYANGLMLYLSHLVLKDHADMLQPLIEWNGLTFLPLSLAWAFALQGVLALIMRGTRACLRRVQPVLG